jgi:hypothetical protein
MKKYFSMLAFLTIGAMTFTSCSNDDDDKDKVVPMRTVADGVLVLNEGNYFSNINGSLDYLNYKSSNVTRNCFQTANGRSLGGTPNDAIINDEDELYIATTFENRVEIADAKTMKSVAVAKIRKPRELASDGSYVYVSSYTGRVYKIDDKSHEVVDSSEVIGTNLEGIAVYKGYVYVSNAWNDDYTYNTNVVKLDVELNKVKDITVVANPGQLIAYENYIYVASQGNYIDVQPTVQRINCVTDEVSVIGTASMMACNNDRLYMINVPYGSPATYSYYDIRTQTTQKWIDGSEIYSPYAMAVDPITDEVFITSQNEDVEKHIANFYADGYLTQYSRDGVFKKKYVCGVNPGTILFATRTAAND